MQKIDLNEAMEQLDLSRGGVFPGERCGIVPNNSFLILSYGGAGASALGRIRERLKKALDSAEMEKHVRFLAIDSDRSAQYGEETSLVDGRPLVRMVERFPEDEFFWLSNAPARGTADEYAQDPTLQGWLPPELVERIRSSPGVLDGRGASGIRQLGRLLLYPLQTRLALQERVVTLVRELTDDRPDRLRVIVVSGISGGTGSGIAVDATYLIRNWIDQMPGMSGRASCAGFLLLPPTGRNSDPTWIQMGDRNGYAALKEIDHYMTIPQRGELYECSFPEGTVRSGRPLFDSCVLVDGCYTQSGVSDPGARANEVVADSILDLMTAVLPEGNFDRMNVVVDRFLNDRPIRTAVWLGGMPAHRAPRSANYIYSALGHGKAMIPMELLKGYLAYRYWEKIRQKLMKNGPVSGKEAAAFLQEIKSPDFWPVAPQEQRRSLFGALTRCFTDPNRGPYYTLNMLGALRDACEAESASILKRAIYLGDRQRDIARLACIREDARHLSIVLYGNYVKVLEQMERYLKQPVDVLFDREKMAAYCGDSYSFCPICFGSMDPGSAAVKRYLDLLLSRKGVEAMAEDLLREMFEHRPEWAQLVAPGDETPVFNACARIRDFWQDQIGRIMQATPEEILGKYCAQDPSAEIRTENTAEGHQLDPQSQTYLDQAARVLVDEMLGTAGSALPLAQLQTGIIPENALKIRWTVTIPRSAGFLREAIERRMKDSLGAEACVEVQESASGQWLSCSSAIDGLPAYMFSWVQRAELTYETALRSGVQGLHLRKEAALLPALLPRDIWDLLPTPGYRNEREAGICEKCRDLFDRAKALGLTLFRALLNDREVGAYVLSTLPARYRPDPALIWAVDGTVKGTPAYEGAERALADERERKARALLDELGLETVAGAERERLGTVLGNRIALTSRELRSSSGVMAPQAGVPAGWNEDLAAALLRQSPDLCDELRGSVEVLERLVELAAALQKEKQDICAFAHLLLPGFFGYDRGTHRWCRYSPDGEKVLCQLDADRVEFQERVRHYVLFRAFSAQSEQIVRDLGDVYDDAAGLHTDDRVEKIRKLRALLDARRYLTEELMDELTWEEQENGSFKLRVSPMFRAAAQQNGYDADAIADFYDKLLEQLEIAPEPDFHFSAVPENE